MAIKTEIEPYIHQTMTKDTVSAITNKLIQYITMAKIQLPEFLSTIEKYNKVVQETNTTIYILYIT